MKSILYIFSLFIHIVIKNSIKLIGDILKKTKIFFINGFILTITTFVMKSIGMVFNLYVSNKIGSEAIGVFSLVMSVYIFAITLATTGLSLACTCIVSEEFAKGNYFNGLKAVRSCLIFSLVLGVGTCFLILLFFTKLSHFFHIFVV